MYPGRGQDRDFVVVPLVNPVYIPRKINNIAHDILESREGDTENIKIQKRYDLQYLQPVPTHITEKNV